MTSKKPTTVAEYLAAQPPSVARALREVRAAIRKALPDAEECISYGIPAYRVDGGIALYFAGWKRHWSLYPIQAETAESFAQALAPYEVNQKGTARFPIEAKVPIGLVARIAKHRARAVGAARVESGARRTSTKKARAARKTSRTRRA